MLRNCHISLLVLALGFLILPACAGAHWFPRLKPLFVGLDEAKMTPAARATLGQAKEDFCLARQGKSPVHARYVGVAKGSQSRVFAGNGYSVTLVNQHCVTCSRVGPEIVIEPSVTGGRAYHYDEIDEVN